MSEFFKATSGGITTCLNIILSPDPAKSWSPGNNIHKHSQFIIDSNNSNIAPLMSTGPLLNIKEVEKIIPSLSFLDLKAVEIPEEEEVEELTEKDSLELYFDGPSDLELAKLEIINNSWSLTPIFEDLDQDIYRAGSPSNIEINNSIMNQVFDKSRPETYLMKGLNSKPGTGSMIKTLIPYAQFVDKVHPNQVVGLADYFNEMSMGIGLDLGNAPLWNLRLASIIMRNELARTANPSYYHKRGYLDPKITKANEISNRWLSLAEIPSNKRFIEDSKDLSEVYQTTSVMFSEILMMQRVIDDITLFSKLGILGNGGFLSTLIIPEVPEDDIKFAKSTKPNTEEISLLDEHLVSTTENYLMSKFINMDYEYNPPFFLPIYEMDGPGVYYKNYLYSLLLFERLYFRYLIQVLEWNAKRVAADPTNIYDISEEMFKQHNPKRGGATGSMTEANLKKIYTAQKELFKIIHTPVMPRIGGVNRMDELNKSMNWNLNLQETPPQLPSELKDILNIAQADKELKEWLDEGYLSGKPPNSSQKYDPNTGYYHNNLNK
jgi:hypothetical protein